MILVPERPPGPLLSAVIERAIAEHGAWRVLRAALAAALSGRRPLRPAAGLNRHLRRDIGLPPEGAVRPRLSLAESLPPPRI